MINGKANNKLENGIYKKNNKTLGKTLRITNKSSSKKIQPNLKIPNSFTSNNIPK